MFLICIAVTCIAQIARQNTLCVPHLHSSHYGQRGFLIGLSHCLIFCAYDVPRWHKSCYIKVWGSGLFFLLGKCKTDSRERSAGSFGILWILSMEIHWVNQLLALTLAMWCMKMFCHCKTVSWWVMLWSDCNIKLRGQCCPCEKSVVIPHTRTCAKRKESESAVGTRPCLSSDCNVVDQIISSLTLGYIVLAHVHLFITFDHLKHE